MGRRGKPGIRAVPPAALIGAALVALVVLWRIVPLGEALNPETLSAWIAAVRETPVAAGVAVLAVCAGSLVFAPILLLITATALVLGPVTGFLCALTGAMASAVVGFAAGRALGRRAVERLAARRGRAARVLSALHTHGLKTVIVVRILPVLLYGLVSVACGASGMGWRPYLWGTLIGMVPVIAAASLFGEGLNHLLRTGTVWHAGAIGFGMLVAMLMARWAWARLADSHSGGPRQSNAETRMTDP